MLLCVRTNAFDKNEAIWWNGRCTHGDSYLSLSFCWDLILAIQKQVGSREESNAPQIDFEVGTVTRMGCCWLPDLSQFESCLDDILLFTAGLPKRDALNGDKLLRGARTKKILQPHTHLFFCLNSNKTVSLVSSLFGWADRSTVLPLPGTRVSWVFIGSFVHFSFIPCDTVVQCVQSWKWIFLALLRN